MTHNCLRLENVALSSRCVRTIGDCFFRGDAKGHASYIADVSGHGVAPGVLMGMVKSAARMYLSSNEGSGRFLERLNSVLYPIISPGLITANPRMCFGARSRSRLQ